MRFCAALLLVPFLIAAVPATRAVSAADAVRRDYADLKRALENGDGAAAAALMSKQIRTEYEEARKLALDSRDVDLESIGQMQVLLMLQFRYQADRKSLEEMKDGAGAFAWGVEKGLVKKENFRPIDLRGVTIEGDRAIATLNNGGQPVDDLVLYFEKKPDGRWALQLERIMEAMEAPFAQVRKESKKTKVELAIYFMEKTYGKPIPPAILDGPLK